jgi:hypothetical protein
VIEIAAVAAFYKQRGIIVTELMIQMADDLFAARHMRCDQMQIIKWKAGQINDRI